MTHSEPSPRSKLGATSTQSGPAAGIRLGDNIAPDKIVVALRVRRVNLQTLVLLTILNEL